MQPPALFFVVAGGMYKKYLYTKNKARKFPQAS